MKKLSYLLIFAIAVLFASCTSCRHNDQVDPLDVPTEFEKNLTVKDTNDVKKVIDEFMAHIMNEEYYDAASMVFRQEHKSKDLIEPRELNDQEMDRLVAVYKLFPVVDYNIEYMRFREEGLNEVCINVIMQKGQNGKPDATSKLYFNPIYFMDGWRLVLDDTHNGTKTFVPVQKRDSMKNVYHHSGSYKTDSIYNKK